ncbi:hypothetical protein THRCLA_05480 [Thraustotheca clavata]|uniref:HIG1 domain-containing protein n=1 Tax=Thraustotheca clavata TaxID=74557 RepID=A0A1V9ZVU5_9STRA|nr:hypothetical protein THRCLA_05480 [Thraustotheca clavata]
MSATSAPMDAKTKRDIVITHSTTQGLKAGGVAAVVAGSAVALANNQSQWFRNRLGVSGKVGLAVMASLATFAIVSEQDLLRGSRNPDQFIAEMNQTESVQVKKADHHLPLYQQAANYVYDYPFRTLVSSAVPLVGLIFYEQSRNANIQFSQKIMHTRIYGQGASDHSVIIMSVESKRDIITANSLAVGLQASAVSSLAMGAIVYAANQVSPTFRNRLGLSGKIGFVAMAGLGSFFIAGEQDLLKGSRNPDAYIADLEGKKAEQSQQKSSLSLPKQVANYVYDNPFRTLAMTATPLVAAIYWDQSRNAHIQVSQKIMHTRIYGQGACVVLLLSTMAFHDWMSKRGHFE